MANVSPYRGIHYNKNQIPSLADVIVPPYDVIPKGDEQKYWNRSPYNFAHLDLAKKADDDYAHSAASLAKWREIGVLHEDKFPSYYLYEQKFKVGTATHHRRTLMCAVELRDFSEGVILPHENTHGKYKKDRLQILTATQCQFSHIFGMVKDQDGYLESLYEEWIYHAPFLHATDSDGVEHTVWQVEGSTAPGVATFFADRPIYIVDGHHRYESALQYAKQVGAKGNPNHPASRMIFAVANVYDPALVVFPTHRWLKGAAVKLDREAVERKFSLLPMTSQELKAFCGVHHDQPQFALFAWNNLFLATPREWKKGDSAVNSLAVTWSDNALLRDLMGIKEDERSSHIQYEKSIDLPWDQKTAGDVIIFHAPPSVESVTAVSDEKAFMPQKSTYFYPKLAAGLTLRSVKA